MSGPKSSRYTLTREQREALMISQQKDIVRRERARFSILLAQVENEALHLQSLSEERKLKCEALLRKYVPLLSGHLPNDRKLLVAETERIRDGYLELNREAQEIRGDRIKRESVRRKQMAEEITRGYGATLDSALDARRDAARQRHEQRLLRLEAIAAEAMNEETSAQARRLAAQYQNTDSQAFRDTLFITDIQPLLKRFQREQAQYTREEREYQKLLLRYADLCQELSLPEEPQPWTPGATDTLRDQVEVMESTAIRQKEEAYIRQALDEVMLEMGYPLLGQRDVTKRSGRRFHHVLYAFEDGTGIDVTYSDEGQIAMELGGLDDCDRIPDDHEMIYLCDAMDGFCVSFEQIEERLRRRGVIPRERLRMLPPAEENAQIINTKDYELKKTPSTLRVEHSLEAIQTRKRMARGDD